MLFGLIFVVVALSYSPTAAQFDSTGCADPTGLEECTSQVSAELGLCEISPETQSSSEGVVQCGCAQDIGNMNCYATHCWNRVFECEYQNFIGSYFELCPTAQFPVPYSPLPNGTVPDSCSCDIGKIMTGITKSIQQGHKCSPSNETGPIIGLTEIHADDPCGCCVYSGAISSVYNLCPTTNPNLTGLMTVTEFANQVPFNVCTPFLSKIDCGSMLSLDAATVGGTFFKPDTLPITVGTATLSNLPGTVTAPASGSVFTYTNGGDGVAYTIRAANTPQGGSGRGMLSAAAPKSPDRIFQFTLALVIVLLICF